MKLYTNKMRLSVKPFVEAYAFHPERLTTALMLVAPGR